MTRSLPVPERIREDDLLRAAGYVIHARETGKPAVWTKGGTLFSHDTALADVRKALARELDGGLKRRNR